MRAPPPRGWRRRRSCVVRGSCSLLGSGLARWGRRLANHALARAVEGCLLRGGKREEVALRLSLVQQLERLAERRVVLEGATPHRRVAADLAREALLEQPVEERGAGLPGRGVRVHALGLQPALELGA